MNSSSTIPGTTPFGEMPENENSTLHPAIFFLMWLNIIITGGGNLITMVAFLSSREIRSKPGNIYILNLALADMKVGFISLPFFNLWWHYGTWTFGEMTCKLWLIVDYTAVTQSMIAIILISWDRYWMVTSINTYQNKQTTRLAGIIIGATWAFWYIYYILLVVLGERAGGPIIDYSNECDLHINHRLNYTLFEIIGLFFVPFVIIAYLNLKIFISVKRRFTKGNEMSQKNRKAAVTLSILVSAYLICWLPYHIVLLMETVQEGGIQYPIVAFVEYLLWLNSAVNPFVYVCTNPLFQQQLMKIFCCGKRVTRQKSVENTQMGSKSVNLATISKSLDTP